MYSAPNHPSFSSADTLSMDEAKKLLAQACGASVDSPVIERLSSIHLSNYDKRSAMDDYMRFWHEIEQHPFNSDGHPPSVGDVRQIVVSEASGNNQMYSDGELPSFNDVGRREPSQTEALSTDYEVADSEEVVSGLNDLLKFKRV
ncbi:hypothetical protein L2E82_11219 [Cichorium intybus]|uniref:Uncharacterized protein n=1 Tax=Cichorium intybus TaxID=13427 RepID=A0ACB9GDQ9_CICIN|nr:hypothetical protein L2E82_11219 [Cichorium intybus]